MDTKKLSQEWFNSANSDFRYAQVGLEEDDIFPQIAFLSQQIAEKYLKGYLVLNNIKPNRTHELSLLLDECVKINPDLELIRDACETLSGFYIETRYPPDIPDYTKEDIEKAFEAAKQVKEKIGNLEE